MSRALQLCSAIFAVGTVLLGPAQGAQPAPPIGSASSSVQARNLRGLKAMRLAILLPPGSDELGFFEARFRTSVELALRKIGIKIVTEQTPKSTPYMGVLIAPSKLGSTELVFTNVSVFVYAPATIEPNNVHGLVAIWSPWAESVFASLADTAPAEKKVGELVDRFSNEWLAAQ